MSILKKVLFFLLMSCSYVYSQDINTPELPNLVMPSPSAYEMTKYGNLPIGMFTGTPNINVPLYNFSTKNLSVPIHLDYSSNGIKVDQLSSNVGLGWSLTAGGVISRIVRGKEDENYKLVSPIEEITREELYEIEFIPENSTSLVEYGIDPQKVKYIYDGVNNSNIDTEADLFSYNINGMSGKIVIDGKGRIYTVPHTNLKVEFEINMDSESTYSNDKVFKVTTPDGVQYVFSDVEMNYSRSFSGSQTPPEQGYITSWYISKIVHPHGDEINFIYDQNNITETYTASQSQSLELPVAYPYIVSGHTPTSGIVNSRSDSRILRKRLIEINSNQYGKVLFDNSLQHPDPAVNNYRLVNGIEVYGDSNKLLEDIDFSYHYTSSNRVFLDSVNYNTPGKTYSFEYIDYDLVPARFSYSQDYWGYFNGKTNNSLLPDLGGVYPVFETYTNNLADRDPVHSFSKKGLLKKVVYPTKGYTEIAYEANTYYGDVVSLINSTPESISLYGGGSNSTTFTLDNAEDLSVFISYSVDDFELEGCSGLPEEEQGHVSARVKVYDVSNGNNIVYNNLFTASESSTDYSIQIGLEAGKTYTLEISNNDGGSVCSHAFAGIKYVYEENSLENIETGGSRVSVISDFSGDGILANRKKYYYGKLNDLNKSSGNATKKGIGHVSKRKEYISNPPSITSQEYITLKSTGSFPLVNSGSNNIYYKYVTISHGDDNFSGGGEWHEFIVNRDTPGQVLLGQSDLIIPNFTNFGWDNGLERKVKYFKSDTTKVVKYKENFYKLDQVIGEIPSYYIAPYYNQVVPMLEPTYKCKDTDLTRQTPVWQCQSDHIHKVSSEPLTSFMKTVIHYSGSPGPITYGESKCRTNGGSGNVLIRQDDHPCYGLVEGEDVSFPETIRNLNVFKYKTYSNWHYLDKTLEIVYDKDGLNPVESSTEYYYDNVNHLLPTRTVTTTSKEEVIITKNEYLLDIEASNRTAAEDKLVEDYQINKLLNTKIYIDKDNDGLEESNELVGSQKTNYSIWANSNLSLPSSVETSKGVNATGDDERLVYHGYDENGNIAEVSKPNGMHIYYIWGYNKTLPIAKIEGFKSEEINSSIQTLINAAVSISDLEDSASKENNLLQALTDIRNSTDLSNSMVTTYTYKPMVGISTITDPKGYTTYYEYDDFGRLETVKDDSGNILSSNEYHYKNQ